MQLPGFLKQFYYVWVALVLAGSFWVGDTLIDSIFFEKTGFFEELYPDDPKELWMRILVVAVFLLFGLYVQVTSNRKARVYNDLVLGGIIFEDATHAIMVTDSENRILKVNSKFEQITGYTKAGVLGQNPCILQSGKYDREFYAAIWEQLQRDGKWEGEISARRPSGEIYLKYMSITTVRDADGHITNQVGIFRDISHIRETEKQLEYLAHYDALTGLGNRSLLNAYLKQIINLAHRHEWQFALVFLDLDHFKEVNDCFGHSAGDQLLVEVANRLQGCVRESDLITRPGGDEFVILLTKVSGVSDISEILAKIRSALAQTFNLDGCEIFSNASMGISLYPHDGEDPETLLRNADSAMYEVKKEGRNNWAFYSKDMNQQLRHRLHMVGDLRRAVEEDKFKLFYQPQIDLNTDEIVGAEALIRWEHPESGMINPNDFIPLAEDTGIIDEIGIWTLREACRQFRAWQDDGLYLPRISVNVSARQFKNRSFANHVASIVKEAGIDPHHLELEITESLLLQSSAALQTDMHRLRGLGISFSIDDFGTGYSSLAYLNRFPISNVKIDRSFVCNIPNNKNDAAITKTIINMAKNLNMQVIAEGVETGQQLTFLSVHGCNMVQGYLISHPLPSAEFETFLRKWESACGLHSLLSASS